MVIGNIYNIESAVLVDLDSLGQGAEPWLNTLLRTATAKYSLLRINGRMDRPIESC